MKVRDKDKGFKKFKRHLGDIGNAQVSVGIHAGEGDVDHDGPTVLEVGIWNEFGTVRMPARSFLRAWFDENRDRAENELGTLLTKQEDPKQALELFGMRVVGEVQQRISDRIPPPNAPSTIARKGSDVPLINTGVLRSSITHQVRQ